MEAAGAQLEQQLDVASVTSDVRTAARRQRADHDVALRRLLGLGDSLAVLISLALALMLASLTGDHRSAAVRIAWGLIAIPLMVLLFKLYGLYDRDVKRISHSTVDDLPWLVHAVMLGTLLLWLYADHTPMHRLDFAEVVIFAFAAVGTVSVIRFAVRRTARRWIGPQRALLVGGGQLAQTLVSKLANHPEYGLEVIGSLAPADATDATVAQLPVLGDVAQLEQVVQTCGVTRVVFAGADINEPELEQLLRDCRSLSIGVLMLPTLSGVLGPAVEIDDIEGVTVLGVNPPWLPRSSRAIKRAMDLLIAVPMLLIVSPVLVLVAIAIKLDSRGPVFFAQERVGRGGRRFRLHKLRTMTVDAEAQRERLLAHSTDPSWLKLDRDPRVTRIGRWLRRLSLDELPQLWNVVRGEMSMVGPRPLIPAEDERVQGWGRGRLDLTPGITGYWQVLGRTRIPFEEMVKLDYLYVMNWSLWSDVRLMLRTLPVVIGGDGAN
jgi:exopolysaccharide biosynthesis polyprenyl glycosylphosphotransferase